MTSNNGQWTAEDLPYQLPMPGNEGGYLLHSPMREVLAEWLNAHHPKPEQTMVPARPVSPEERGELWGRIRDELRGVYSSTTEHDHRKLDLAASASADTAVEYLNDRGGLGIDAREPLERALRERDEARRLLVAKEDEAVNECHRAYRERDEWKARAEAAEEQWKKWEHKAGQRDELLIQVEAERGAAITRAEAAEWERDRWKAAAKRALEHRDEWKARAEKAEKKSSRKPGNYMLWSAGDGWGRAIITSEGRVLVEQFGGEWSDLTHISDSGWTYREGWDGPASAVSRADIEKAIRGKVWAANREPNKAGFHRVHVDWATDAVWSLVSGADPAVHVVRESDLPAARVDGDYYVVASAKGDYKWPQHGPSWWAGRAQDALAKAARYTSLARLAADREATVDPVEEKARVEADRRYSGDPNHAFIEGALWAARHLNEQEAGDE